MNSPKTTSVTMSSKQEVSRLLIGIAVWFLVISILNYCFPVISALFVTVLFIDAGLRSDKNFFVTTSLKDLLQNNFKEKLNISHKISYENGFIENRVSVELKEDPSEKDTSTEEPDLEEKIKANKKSK